MVHNIWVIIELSFLESILLRKGIHFWNYPFNWLNKDN